MAIKLAPAEQVGHRLTAATTCQQLIKLRCQQFIDFLFPETKPKPPAEPVVEAAEEASHA